MPAEDSSHRREEEHPTNQPGLGGDRAQPFTRTVTCPPGLLGKLYEQRQQKPFVALTNYPVEDVLRGHAVS